MLLTGSESIAALRAVSESRAPRVLHVVYVRSINFNAVKFALDMFHDVSPRVSP